MLKSEYESLFWICRKPLNKTVNDDEDAQCNNEEDASDNGYPFRCHQSGFKGPFPLK